MGLYALVFIILLILSSFFSGTETALFSFSDIEIELLTDNKFKMKLKKIKKDPESLLSTILLANLIVNIVNANIITFLFYTWKGETGVAYAIVFETVIILIFGEIIPKTVASRYYKTFAKISLLILPFFIFLLKPVIIISNRFVAPIIRFFNNKIPDIYESINKNDILMMLRSGKDISLDPIEEDILMNIIKIQTRPVKSISERVDKRLFISTDATIEEIKRKFIEMQTEHLIVFYGKIENIKGILPIQRFMNDEENWNTYLEPPFYVPNLRKITGLWEELKKHKIAIVVDEYGRVVGILNYNDFIKYCINSENELYENIEKISDNSIIVSYDTEIDAVNKILGVNLNSDIVHTIGGYIEELSGRIPKENDIITFDNLKFIVLKSSGKKVDKIKIYKMVKKDD